MSFYKQRETGKTFQGRACLRPYLLHELTQRAPKQEIFYAFHEQEDIN